MADRPTWKGFLRLSLVTFPVRSYTASISTEKIQLHQLHTTCKSRIRYQKVCPIHGDVDKDEIVMGYEHGKDEYVVIDQEEWSQLRTAGDKSISVDAFVAAGAVDAIYFTDRSYYLVPDGPVGKNAYALVQRAMVDESLHALAKVVLTSREQLVLLRPIENLVLMTVLSQESEMKSPAHFEKEIEKTKTTPKELALTKTLIHSMVEEKLDYGQYKDEYVEQLRDLVQAKVAGKAIVGPADGEEPTVINLMDALRQSVAQMKNGKKVHANRGAPAKTKASTRARKKRPAPARRVRKSG